MKMNVSDKLFEEEEDMEEEEEDMDDEEEEEEEEEIDECDEFHVYESDEDEDEEYEYRYHYEKDNDNKRLTITQLRECGLNPNRYKKYPAIHIVDLNLNDRTMKQFFPNDVVFDEPNTTIRHFRIGSNVCPAPKSHTITRFPATFFNNMPNLEFLDLSENHLSELTPGMFDNLPELTELILSCNELTSIPDGIFDNNHKLRRLWLSGNKITDFTPLNKYRHIKNV